MAVLMTVASFFQNASIYYVPLIFGAMILYYLIIGLPSLYVWYFIFRKLENSSSMAVIKSGFLAVLFLSFIVGIAEWVLSFFINFSKYGAGAVFSFLLIALPGLLVSCLFIGFKLKKTT